MTITRTGLPRWTLWAPLAAWLAPCRALALPARGAIAAIARIALAGSVFVGVHRAQVMARHVGEAFGTVVLALAATAIEAALIISAVLDAGGEKPGRALDTVFAAVMIVCNGVVGNCLLAGSLRHVNRTSRFAAPGSRRFPC